MDDTLLVGVLHGFADVQEQLQSLFDREAVFVAMLRDGQAFDVLHHEVGPTARGQSRIVDAGHVGVFQQRQCLLLGLETVEHPL